MNAFAQIISPQYFICVVAFVLLQGPSTSAADRILIEQHCSQCHGIDEPKGGFDLLDLGDQPSSKSIDSWVASLDRVRSHEMPPSEYRLIQDSERDALIQYLSSQIRNYSAVAQETLRIAPRRLNNREFENSVRDVLRIEDVGTHQPTDDLLGDALHGGFDTHGETLGFSQFHLEQYIEALREILDACILSGDMPPAKHYEISSTEILSAHTSQNVKRPERRGTREGFDFLDPKELAYFEPFQVVETSGWYQLKIECRALDRGYYESDKTGIYDADPIQLKVLMGNRERVFDIPDKQVIQIELNEWLAAGTRVRLKYPTDGLTLRGNGNFKFQNAIAGEYIKEHDPELYAAVAASIETKPGRRVLRPESWHHWVKYWRGPRPRIIGATIDGPLYNTWPPKRQANLLGEDPTLDQAFDILHPIAERAWRRKVHDGELDGILRLVHAKSSSLGVVDALKEGIVVVLASPSFLLHSLKDLEIEERFAAKYSCFLTSSIPSAKLRESVAHGDLNSFDMIRSVVQLGFSESQYDAFLRAFPIAWLQLNDINFMAPDPDRYPHYHRKRVADDMIDETLALFRHIVEHDLPVTELITADYSFINADLARVYNIEGVPQDSVLRKYEFSDEHRGGLLGTGAFLTLTADSLGTSPIHRAVYVMENFLGLHPAPPPADVKIEEPDIRSAKSIREVLVAHQSDTSCAECHRRIDPYGWAFENYDSVGAWRNSYDGKPMDGSVKQAGFGEIASTGLSIDSSATLPDGTYYGDISGFRQQLSSKANLDRFVRCFVTKLLTYANGEEPDDFIEVEKIVAKSAEHEHRILATISAVIDSPLFREVR